MEQMRLYFPLPLKWQNSIKHLSLRSLKLSLLKKKKKKVLSDIRSKIVNPRRRMADPGYTSIKPITAPLFSCRTLVH